MRQYAGSYSVAATATAVSCVGASGSPPQSRAVARALQSSAAAPEGAGGLVAGRGAPAVASSSHRPAASVGMACQYDCRRIEASPRQSGRKDMVPMSRAPCTLCVAPLVRLARLLGGRLGQHRLDLLAGPGDDRPQAGDLLGREGGAADVLAE